MLHDASLLFLKYTVYIELPATVYESLWEKASALLLIYQTGPRLLPRTEKTQEVAVIVGQSRRAWWCSHCNHDS